MLRLGESKSTDLVGGATVLNAGLRYLATHPVRAAAAVLLEPAESLALIQDRLIARNQQPVPPDLYCADLEWERRLHEFLGEPWPCSATSEFWHLWPEVIRELEMKGIRAGPESFSGGWNDGDAGLVRAIWCLCRHLRPQKIIETGVAHGVTSRCILEALSLNRVGHLWSIDRPPLNDAWHKQIGLAVGNSHRERWSYIRGSSRRQLPKLLSHHRQIDIFVHDSLHSEHNVRFELDSAWLALREGAAVVVDDVDTSWAFHRFSQAHPDCCFLTCEAEPLRPDLRRVNQKGFFGIGLKVRPG